MLAPVSILLTAHFFLVFSANTRAESLSIKPADIYLTQDRVCRKCVWEVVDADHVQLTNLAGVKGVYALREILGVDTHPALRKWLYHSAHGIGVPGPILMPDAFDEGKPEFSPEPYN
ncbi:MAG: hypothetical protein K2X01_03640 [Cyanobacteria bacterium]|nr:hypothetical protein [Cyanobacteriota bacterium]